MAINNRIKKVRIAFFADMLIADFDGAARTMYQLLNRIDITRFQSLLIGGNGTNAIQGYACIHIPSFRLRVNKNYIMALPFPGTNKLYDELHALMVIPASCLFIR